MSAHVGTTSVGCVFHSISQIYQGAIYLVSYSIVTSLLLSLIIGGIDLIEGGALRVQTLSIITVFRYVFQRQNTS